MKKTTLIPALLIGVLLTGGIAFASPGQGKRDCGDSCDRKGQGMTSEQHEKRMENRLEKMAVILDLTEQQKEQLENLFEKKWQNHQSMRAEMQASRKDLREYKQGKEFNEADFRAKAQKHAELKTEMMVQHAKTKQQAFAVLTPEQQQKAEKLHGMHGESFFGKHHGKRGGERDCDGQKNCGKRCNN
ncbi:MAG: Spy/CpxP family protein refolding chaperone [Desulfuromusa sp.]|nr:Spy/CpxP family protein refolding chaperone [Desulfuromusa sp.]